MTLRSYPIIYNLGHKALAELFEGPVSVEEKIDGSQFSFARVAGELVMRSKGQQVFPDAPDAKMFRAGMIEAAALDLTPGWVYRAEYLAKPKHNTLAYARVPERHLIVFDIDRGDQDYLAPKDRIEEGARVGLETVPIIHEGLVSSADEVRALLERESILGAVPIEGVVIKNYAKFGPDKKTLMGKFVSEAFKEKHIKEWKQANPGAHDVVQTLIESFRTEARWAKAVQHLRDDGLIEGSPRDIGLLMKEAGEDILSDSRDEILEVLWKWAWPKIQRGVTAGLPNWYKQQLLDDQFEEGETR